VIKKTKITKVISISYKLCILFTYV